MIRPGTPAPALSLPTLEHGTLDLASGGRRLEIGP